MADEQGTGAQGDQQGTGDASGQHSGTAAGAGNGGAGEDKKFTQAELDAIVKDRIDREKRNADAKAQREREAAEAKALEEQSKFKELADQRQAKIAELEPFQAKSERYEKALTTLLEAERKGMPGHITALLDKLDPAEQLEWIASNREALATDAGDGTAKTTPARSTPATPKPAGNPGRADLIEQTKKELQASGLYGRI
jgi:hypothetical protein